MDEEIEIPKKQKKSRKRTESDSSEVEEVEVVEAVSLSRIENILTPQKNNFEDVPTENHMGIMIPDEKMSHRKIGMMCNSCFVSETCPKYKEDSECTMDWGSLFKKEFTPTDLLQSSIAILDLQLIRINRAFHMEQLNQGLIDPELSRLIQTYFEMMKTFKELSERPQPTISITAKGDAARGGGVLSQLLGLK